MPTIQTINDGVERTIPLHVRRAVEAAPDKTWLVAGDRCFTYAGALGAVERAASWLRAHRIGRGDRVIVTTRNTPEYLLSWLALMEVGATHVPVNPRGTDEELAGFVRQVEPALLVTDPVVPASPPPGTPVADVEELFAADADGRGPAAVGERDVAVMIPTSGTTGRSKLVMQTHLAFVMAGEGFPYWLDLGPDDRLLTALPLFHLNAMAYSVLGSVQARAGLVLLPGFSASTLLDSARRYGATQVNMIGAMLEMLVRQPPRDDDADHPLWLCYTGPAPSREHQLEIEARFGFEVRSGYAMSETTYGLVWRRGTRPYGTLGSVRQHPTLGHVNDARVMEGGRPVAPGETGELELRNPCIMDGYYRMPEETAAVIVDGWLRTGDLVTDNGDGTYTFVGRRKEVIRRRGENLSPKEVEDVLQRHPGVAEAAVIGVPSDLSEEEVKAFVVPARADLDLAAVRQLAAEHLSAFKVPRYLEVVESLPHTPTGRVAKHLLPQERTPGEVDFA